MLYRYAILAILLSLVLPTQARSAQADLPETAQIVYEYDIEIFNPHAGGGCGTQVCQESKHWISGYLDLPQFDPTLGALDSLTFETSITLEFQTRYQLSPWFPPDSPGTSRFSAGLDVFLVRGETIAQLIAQQAQTECEPTCQLDWHFESTSATVFNNDLARFIGSGTVDIQSEGQGGMTGSTNYHYGVGNPSVSLRATYDYTPVPEPSTALLLGIGLLVAIRGRRRKA